MHEIYGGCIQRLLLKWFFKGHLLPSRQRGTICLKVKQMSHNITEDFARKNMDLYKINQWKCSEFRTFLLYMGPVALAGIDACKYDLFMLLFTAVYIMAHPIFHKVSSFLENARHFCEEYIIKLEEMYGYQEIVKKVHNLQHLPDDVLRNGPLEITSAFRYENFFQLQFNIIHSGANIPAQILNRTAERRNHGFSAVQSMRSECGIPRGKFRKDSPPTSLWHRNIFLSTKSPNCFILIHRKPAVLTYCSNDTIRFRYFLEKGDFFIYPIKSSLLYIYLCESLGQEEEGHPSEIMCKCISFNHAGKNVIFPLVHTFLE